jgi:hypothetical protein
MSQTSIINKKTGTLYVREIEEFKEKFEEKPLTEHDIFW